MKPSIFDILIRQEFSRLRQHIDISKYEQRGVHHPDGLLFPHFLECIYDAQAAAKEKLDNRIKKRFNHLSPERKHFSYEKTWQLSLQQ